MASTAQAERQRRYRRRVMDAVRNGRGRGLREIAATLSATPHGRGDDAPRSLVQDFLASARPAAMELVSKLWVEGEEASEDAARAIGAFFDIDPDPTRGATWSDLHRRILDHNMTASDIYLVVGTRIAAKLPETQEYGEAIIGLRSAYDLRPLLERLGLWAPADGT